MLLQVCASRDWVCWWVVWYFCGIFIPPVVVVVDGVEFRINEPGPKYFMGEIRASSSFAATLHPPQDMKLNLGF